MKAKAVKGFLKGHGVPIGKWGTGGMFSVDDLKKEVANGFAELIEVKDLGVVRRIRTVALDVYHQGRMGEQFQLFSKGTDCTKPNQHTLYAQIPVSQAGDERQCRVIQKFLESIGIVYRKEKIVPNGIEKIPPYKAPFHPGIFVDNTKQKLCVHLATIDYHRDGYKDRAGNQYVWLRIDQKKAPEIKTTTSSASVPQSALRSLVSTTR